MRRIFSQAGFLGPIGDDLPSLIPLIVSLMVFFSTFSFSFNAFDSKKESFDAAVSILRVSGALRGNSYFSGLADFKAKCSQISDRRFNFVAGLMELPENPFDPADPAHFKGVDIENLGGGFYNTPSGTEKFECSNVLDPASDYPDIHSRDLIVRLFPVALELNADDGIQSGFAIKPMVLVVVVWRPG